MASYGHMDADPGLGLVAELGAFRELANGTSSRMDVRSHLIDRLEALPVVPYLRADPVHAAEGDHPPLNLVTVVRGRERDWRPLAIGARYDLPNPSILAGVVAAMEACRQLAAARLDRDVILALFDDGVLSRDGVPSDEGAPSPERPGAQAWFAGQLRHDLKAAVVLGRLSPTEPASADGERLLVLAGVETDARLPAVLEGAAPLGARLVPTPHVPDGLPFAQHGVPYLRIGCRAAGPKAVALPPDHEAWSHDSLAELAQRAKLAAALTVELLRRLDQARLPGPYRGYDSTEFELSAVSDALGSALTTVGGRPAGREDLERIAEQLNGEPGGPGSAPPN